MDFLRKLTGTHEERSTPKIDANFITSGTDALNLRAHIYDLARSVTALGTQMSDLTERVDGLGGERTSRRWRPGSPRSKAR